MPFLDFRRGGLSYTTELHSELSGWLVGMTNVFVSHQNEFEVNTNDEMCPQVA